MCLNAARRGLVRELCTCWLARRWLTRCVRWMRFRALRRRAASDGTSKARIAAE